MYCAVYQDQFKAGLRLPLHPLIRQILRFYDISLAQIVPNGIRNIMGFMSLLKQHNREPSLLYFRRFFRIQKARGSSEWYTFMSTYKSKVLGGLPDSNKSWKDLWFIVEAPWLDFDVEWNTAPLVKKRNKWVKAEYSQEDEAWTCELVASLKGKNPKVSSLVTNTTINDYQLRGEPFYRWHRNVVLMFLIFLLIVCR